MFLHLVNDLEDITAETNIEEDGSVELRLRYQAH
jgi:hypothetical protein